MSDNSHQFGHWWTLRRQVVAWAREANAHDGARVEVQENPRDLIMYVRLTYGASPDGSRSCVLGITRWASTVEAWTTLDELSTILCEGGDTRSFVSRGLHATLRKQTMAFERSIAKIDRKLRKRKARR